MPSRHKFHLVKVEVEEHHITEEEAEAYIEEEEEALQVQVEGASIKVQFKAHARIKHKVRGMINLKFNVINVGSMVIMQMNVEIRKITWVVNQV